MFIFNWLFGSPIRRAVNKTISNRIRNAEIKFKSECKNLSEKRKAEREELVEQFYSKLRAISYGYNERKAEILEKSVADVLPKIS